MAVNGYIRIIEQKKDRLIGKDKLSYSFELTGKDESALAGFEGQVLSGLRGGAPVVQVASTLSSKQPVVVPLDDLKQKFYTTATDVRSTVVNGMVSQGYFPKSPLKAKGGLYVLATVLFLSTFLLGSLGAGFVIGFIISSIIAFGLCIHYVQPYFKRCGGAR